MDRQKKRKDLKMKKRFMEDLCEDLIIIARLAVYVAVCSAAWEIGKFVISVFLK